MLKGWHLSPLSKSAIRRRQCLLTKAFVRRIDRWTFLWYQALLLAQKILGKIVINIWIGLTWSKYEGIKVSKVVIKVALRWKCQALKVPPTLRLISGVVFWYGSFDAQVSHQCLLVGMNFSSKENPSSIRDSLLYLACNYSNIFFLTFCPCGWQEGESPKWHVLNFCPHRQNKRRVI